MALDDLRGEEAVGLNIGQDLFDRVRRRTHWPSTIICSAWALCIIELSG